MLKASYKGTIIARVPEIKRCLKVPKASRLYVRVNIRTKEFVSWIYDSKWIFR